MMKKIAVLLSVFLAFAVGRAQKVDLVWKDFATVDYQYTVQKYPAFTNPGYQTDGANVYFSEKIESGSRAQPANLEWEKISESSLYDLNPTNLPDRDIFSVTEINDPANGKPYQSLMIAAFKTVKGDIYRLRSFDLVTKPGADAQSRALSPQITAKPANQVSPFKSGAVYKIKVDKSGIFKITRKFLQDNGINPSNIDPRNLKIYGNGGIMLPEYNSDFRFGAPQENAIQVVGEADGKWDDGDYALFYAQGPNGFNLYDNAYNSNGRKDMRIDRSLHLQNIYEDYAYYFISFDQGAGKRISDEKVAPPTELITRYDDYQFIDEEKLNLQKVGRIWTGDSFATEKQVVFSTRSPLRAEDEIYYRISVVAYKGQNNGLKYNMNGTVNLNYTVSKNADLFYKITAFSGVASGLGGNKITIGITPDTSANPGGQFYFDYAEVLYKEDLKFNGTQMNFRDYSLQAGENYGFSVSDVALLDQVWDVSDITNAKKIINSTQSPNFNFGYNAVEDFNNEFVAFKNDAAYSPTFVGKVANQDLHGLSGIDYLIITRSDMLADAARLAKYHQTKEKFKTAVVDVQQIYNEYSSGSQDITAIRDFVTELKNERGGLQFVLLLGDTSYDFKNRISGNDNVIPAYQSEISSDYTASYVTDDYFVMTGTQKSTYLGAMLPDLPIGRLPASNAAEAKLLVDKTLAYYNALPGQSSPFGEWRMKLDFVADDDNDGGGPFHDVMETAINDNFEKGLRTEYNVRKLYLDAFPQEATAGGQRYPQVNAAINGDINNSLYLFYFGHGGINSWAQERVITLEDIRGFNNYNSAYSRFPLVSTITCEFTLWDVPEIASAGEQIIKHKNGGAATMITSSRAISVGYGRIFTDTFTRYIFSYAGNDFLPLGTAHLNAKNYHGADVNHLRVNFLGDPAMKLSRPKQNIVVESVETPAGINQTIRALDFVKVSGYVKNDAGTIDTTFNGRVSINIFDKRLNKKTRNNDGNLDNMPYTEEGSAIVKAAGKVANGKFTVEFYVPKDINYTEGDGRMLVYADNFETAKSAAYDVFNSQKVKVGGINPNGIKDDLAPKVNLYMNNINFADGGITDQNPMLLACITDDTGINSTGAGIGHDITVILDGKVVETKVLNDFFTSGQTNGCISVGADYQKGSVAYPFRNLSPGNHQIVFKVWDINNNSTTVSLNFIVKSEADQKLVLNRLLNWPNPFTSRTYIQFEHNCDDILDVHAQIYTITGKLVKTINQTVVSEPFLQGFRTPRTAVEWDGTDDYGATVGKGTYIYKVFVKSQNQDKCKGSATAMEKAVLLK